MGWRKGQTNRFIIRHRPSEDEGPDPLHLSNGQVIVIFALLLTALVGILGIAIDLSYTYVVEARMQKAADAAALAGAVYLPSDAATGTTKALAVATQNGFSGTGVVAGQDSLNKEQMDVTITQSVPTFFMRVFGITTLTPSRTAHAQFHLPVPMGSPLNSFGVPTATDLQGNTLNFWASINGPCTLKANGDPYATKLTTNTSSNCGSASVANTEYHNSQTGDPGAYDYAVKVPVGASGPLTVQLYDPEFCNRSSQSTDTGDIYFDNLSSTNFNTVFTLYNPSDTPYDLADDTAVGTYTAPGDDSTSTSDGQSGKTHSCSSYWVTGSGGNYTGKWFTAFTVASPTPGIYRLNVDVQTVGSSPADGENEFGIQATLGSGSPQVYAGVAGSQSAMSIFNNLSNGTSYIYLAQLGSNLAGKTMEVDLFDPGDVNGSAVMSFIDPSGNASSFTYCDTGTTLGRCTAGSSVTSVTTASGGNSNFQGHWLVVTIKIPSTYTAPNNGWWKIKYVISGGAAHDRTTWRVEIRDNPVHLVP